MIVVPGSAPRWASYITRQIDALVDRILAPTAPTQLPPFASTNLPNAADYEGAIIYVVDQATVAVSDGQHWWPVNLGPHY